MTETQRDTHAHHNHITTAAASAGKPLAMAPPPGKRAQQEAPINNTPPNHHPRGLAAAAASAPAMAAAAVAAAAAADPLPLDAAEAGGSMGPMTLPPEVEDDDVRVAMIGNVDSGKSTLIGVLTHAALDDGRGSARKLVLKHRHEQENGRTSAVTVELMGCVGRGWERGGKEERFDHPQREVMTPTDTTHTRTATFLHCVRFDTAGTRRRESRWSLRRGTRRTAGRRSARRPRAP
jgi:hypothetical protein